MTQPGFSKYAYADIAAEYAKADVAQSQTDASIVAAQSGKVIRVLSIAFVCGATETNATFNSKGSGAGTAISPVFQNAANGGAVLPHNPLGWFETSTGEGLSLTTGTGSQTGVLVTYVVY
jgi:hypothetical protein